MKWISAVLCVFLLVATLGCSKKEMTPEQGTKFPAPEWREVNVGNYPASMTAVVALPATLAGSVLEKDQLAAFINGECRGVGALEKVNSQDLYFVMIHGMPDESSQVKFKYFSSKTSYMYESTATVNFLVDAVYGTAQNPKTLELSQLK